MNMLRYSGTLDLLILKEALKVGQISLIEYFSETAIIYQSQLNYLQLENKYHKTVANLFKKNYRCVLPRVNNRFLSSILGDTNY